MIKNPRWRHNLEKNAHFYIIKTMHWKHEVLCYQLNTAKSSNAKSVDDVEVRQV